jgi:hypothetical protein
MIQHDDVIDVSLSASPRRESEVVSSLAQHLHISRKCQCDRTRCEMLLRDARSLFTSREMNPTRIPTALPRAVAISSNLPPRQSGEPPRSSAVVNDHSPSPSSSSSLVEIAHSLKRADALAKRADSGEMDSSSCQSRRARRVGSIN